MPGALPRPLRRLLAARIFGVTLLTVLGARIIADGPPNQLVAPGNPYSLAALLAALLIGLGILAGRPRALPFGLVLLSCNIGVAVSQCCEESAYASRQGIRGEAVRSGGSTASAGTAGDQ